MNKCAECKVKFKNGAKKIGCGFCGKWFHVDGNCTDINLQLYELLTKEDQLHWLFQYIILPTYPPSSS